MQPTIAGLIVIQFDHRVWSNLRLVQLRTTPAPAPRPGIAEPHGGQQTQIRALGSTIRNRDLDQDILGIRFRVLNEHVEVAVLVEDSGVEQFVLRLVRAASTIFGHKFGVRELSLRILVEVLHVGMRGRRVEVEVVFLHVLAVIALISC